MDRSGDAAYAAKQRESFRVSGGQSRCASSLSRIGRWWLQIVPTNGTFFLGQLYLAADFQGGESAPKF